MKGQPFTCAVCDGTFLAGKTEDEANDEARERFGSPYASRDPRMVVVCDDCYNQIMTDSHWTQAPLKGEA